jgi:aryl-alcohol dehydrogenase-like predicted oxidoreductase
VPYSPLGKGFLTGKVDEHATFADNDIRARIPRFAPEAIKANWALVRLITKIGEQKGATPAQNAPAWLLGQESWIVPIPGSRKLHRLEENLRAVAVELTADDLQGIKDALSELTIQGERYPKDMAKTSGR